MKTIHYASGQVIFREGEAALAMYEIRQGSVGIFLDYDTAEKRQLTVLKENQLFGEMGLIESAPRSATAVALEEGTVLREIGEDEADAFFLQQPERFLQTLRQMSARIRENTEKYQEVCTALVESERAREEGKKKSEALDRQLNEISKTAKKRKNGYVGGQSTFYPYVREDLEAYEGKRNVVRAGLVERLVVRRIDPEEMHVNPDDEFADPAIGPSDRIINDYVQEIPWLYRDGKAIFPSPIAVFKLESDGYLILNGHHRWAAAIKTGLSKVRAVIMNPPKE
ncbi:MAG: cyclic nucleotide-binding domain-containing protein [Oscillospiraceae bacterium]|nr:cyclic nucleotide-binding domain-containing protein [Oscillospiraceae bacterium]